MSTYADADSSETLFTPADDAHPAETSSTHADGDHDSADSAVASSSSMDRSCFKHMRRDGKHFIMCEPCASHHELLKQLAQSSNKRIPGIAQPSGVLYREETVLNHLQQVYHTEAVKVSRLETLNSAEKLQSTVMGAHISKQNEELANKIGHLMLHTYCDGKKLTLSAWSFPARVVTAHMANEFSFNSDKHSTDAVKDYDFQYLTPAFHLEAMKTIVSQYRESFLKDLLENSLAVSLRCDGSVDSSQIDKIYVLAKCVLKNGQVKELFLGAAEPQIRGAQGILEAVKTACESNLNCPGISSRILEAASSLVTDGASVNSGNKNGLWKLLKEEKDSLAKVYPFVTIWCAVHRTSLAWKQVAKDIQEVSNLISQLSSLSTFFHESAVRTRELREIGEQEEIRIVQFPKYFEVRWAEFTADLFNAVLSNWRALVIYFEKNKGSSKERNGYYQFLIKEENLKLITSLADILSIFSHYQKKLQADSTTILDISRFTTTLKNQLNDLHTKNLIGGWASTLNENLVNRNSDENTVQLHGVTLQCFVQRRRQQHHLYVTDQRGSHAIINETIETLNNFLDERLSLDNDIITCTSPFVDLQPNASLQEVHKMWGPDLALEQLGLQYSDLMDHKDIEFLRQKTLKELIEFLAPKKLFHTLLVVFARILAAKPHSADVERMISANNILKTNLRSSINLETENLYLFIHTNMPVVEKWNPRPAIIAWMKNKNRRVKDTPKAKSQSWYKHIFEEAATASGNNTEEILPKKHTKSFV